VRHDGIRITPADQIEEIVGVLAGRVNKRLVGRLQRQGAEAVGLCLGDGLVAQISRVTCLPIDPGRVGQVTGGNPRLITTLLRGGFLPVLASIGFDEEGEPLNVNADAAAAGLSRLLNASGLVFLTDTPGVLDQHGTPIATLCPRDIEAKIRSGDIRDGMIAKVRSAALASTTATIPVTISSWHEPDAMRNLTRGDLVGTRILPINDPGPATAPDAGTIAHTTTVPNA
jgi:acetylglutamate kinase